MTTTTLQDYMQQISQLLDTSQYIEASQHCRHVLHHYPRHLETYRALGKSYLERQQFGEAIDIFQRVLSVDPNDFVSHIGLAIAYRNDALLANAIWHMERAYEMDPYNMAIREELLELYTANDEDPPEQVGVTRAALANLYVKGELYQQAAAELHTLLAEDPDRLDLEILLVESLWHIDQRIEVNERCLRIVEEMPYCLVANALLGHIRLQNVSIEEARPYLQRVQELMQLDQSTVDTETIVGWLYAYPDSPPLPAQITIEADGDFPQATEPGSMDSQADWPDETADSGDAAYDWLGEALTGQLPPLPDSGPLTALDDADAPEEAEEATDWFLDEPTTDDDTNWLADLTDDAERPDFLDDMAADPETAVFEEESADWLVGTPDSDQTSPSAIESGVPDWLEFDSETFEPEKADPDLAGDWLQGLDENDEDDEDEDWLDQLDDSQAGIAPVADDIPPIESSELSADWLTAEAPPGFAASTSDQDDEQDIADWFAADPDLPESDKPQTTDLEEDSLGWLMTGPLSEADADETAEPDWEDSSADWLMTGPLSEANTDETAEPDLEDDSLDWLMTGPLQQPDSEITPEIDMDDQSSPDWLTTGPLEPDDDETTASHTTPEKEGDLPDWLMTGPLSQLDPDQTQPSQADADPMPEWSLTDSLEDDEVIGYESDGWDEMDAQTLPDWLTTGPLETDDSDASSSPAASIEDDEEEDDFADDMLAWDAAATEAESDDFALYADDEDDEMADTDLPDWMLYNASDDIAKVELDVYDDPIAGFDDLEEDMDDLNDMPIDSRSDDQPDQIPDWLLLHDTDLLEDEESDTDDLDAYDIAATSETADSEPISEWLIDDADDDDQIIDEFSDPDQLFNQQDDESPNLPDWLKQTDSDMLVGSDLFDESVDKKPANQLSTGEILLDEDDEALPDWMQRSVTDNLSGLLAEIDDDTELPEITTEDLLEGEDQQTGLLSRLRLSDDKSGLLMPDVEEMEDAVQGDRDEVDNDLDKFLDDALDPTPDQLDGTDDWLDDLASLPGADDTSVTAIPTTSLPDWLEALAPDSGGDDAPTSNLPDLMPDFEMPADVQESPDDLLDWLQVDETEEESVDIPEIDDPALAGVTETADSLEWMDEDDGADMGDLDWLSEMEIQVDPADSPIEEPIDEFDAETAVSEPNFLDIDDDEDTLDQITGLDDDLEDAMAWLGQLADEEDPDLLPDMPPADEPIAEPAMDSLDDLLADDLSTDDLLGDDFLDEDFSPEDFLAEDFSSDDFADTLLADDLAATDMTDLSDSTADSMADQPTTTDELSQMLGEMGDITGFDDIDDLTDFEADFDEADFGADLSLTPDPESDTPHLDLDLDTGMLTDGIPDDVEDPVAWLEQLAAIQEETLDEEFGAAPTDTTRLDEIDQADFDDIFPPAAPILADTAAPDDADDDDELEEALDWLTTLSEMEDDDEAGEEVAPPAPDDDLSFADLMADDFDADEFVIEEFTAEEFTADEVVAEEFAAEALEDEFTLEEFEFEEVEQVVEVEEIVTPEPPVASEPEPELDELATLLDQLEQQALADLPDELSLSDLSLDQSAIPDDPLADALDWLEQTALAQPSAAEDVATAPPDQEEDQPIAAVAPTAEPTAYAEDSDELAFDQMPEDPDDVMAWLEKLAARQGANLDELPSVSDEDAVSIAKMPKPPAIPDLDEVEAVAPPKAEAAEATTTDAPPALITPEPDLVESALPEEVEPAAYAEDTDELTLDQMPEDPDEVMAWLEKLAARQGANLDELPSVSDEDAASIAKMPKPPAIPDLDDVEDAAPKAEAAAPPALITPEPDVAESTAVSEDIDALAFEFPEDPDEAMAWLEKLAARQGAALDELPSVSDEDAASIAKMPKPIDPEPELDLDDFATTDEFPDLQPTETGDLTALADLTDLLGDDDLDELDALSELEGLNAADELASWADLIESPQAAQTDSLDPSAASLQGEMGWGDTLDEYEKDENGAVDWLDNDADALLGQTDWLTSFDEVDPMGWLEAEEAASSGTAAYEPDLLDVEPPTRVEAARTPEPEPEPLLDDLDLDLDLDLLGGDLGGSSFTLDESQLANAREKLATGSFEDALYAYQSLVKEGGGLSMVIGDLETAVTSHRQPSLQRVLGDAYMRNGQLQKALDTYRDALDAL